MHSYIVSPGLFLVKAVMLVRFTLILERVYAWLHALYINVAVSNPALFDTPIKKLHFFADIVFHINETLMQVMWTTGVMISMVVNELTMKSLLHITLIGGKMILYWTMIQISLQQLRRLHLMIIISQWSIWIVFRKINPYRTSSTVENQIMFYLLRQKR